MFPGLARALGDFYHVANPNKWVRYEDAVDAGPGFALGLYHGGLPLCRLVYAVHATEAPPWATVLASEAVMEWAADVDRLLRITGMNVSVAAATVRVVPADAAVRALARLLPHAVGVTVGGAPDARTTVTETVWITTAQDPCDDPRSDVALFLAWVAAHGSAAFASVGAEPLYEPVPCPSPLPAPLIGGITGVAGAAVAVLAFAHGVRRRWVHRHAPRDACAPFAVLFTDIEDSSGMWTRGPHTMGAALAQHDRILRRLLARHRVYEVKTIGDSFMCACRRASDAVAFALDLQRGLHTAEWDAALVEDRRRGAEWNGPRVRVGVHWGHGEIRWDSVQHRYDYYGTVANVASRIEHRCQGGQVLVSDPVRQQLETLRANCSLDPVYLAARSAVPGAAWTDLGLHLLWGYGDPVTLYQHGLVHTPAPPRPQSARRRSRCAAGRFPRTYPREEGNKWTHWATCWMATAER